MQSGIIEIVGLFVIVVGCGFVVGAATLVSTVLAVLAVGLFLILAGVIAVYVAVSLEKKPKAGTP